ncbi:hypothetical protein KKF61_09165 [Patescibacteria group bacterium]|nr:hypothetical protein [Patescibacteria group bacterium]
MEEYYVNAKPYFYYENKNRVTGALVDADTSVTIAVYDPFGNSVLASETEAMTTTGTTGQYYYNSWTVLATHMSGVYTAIVTVNDTSDVTRSGGGVDQFKIIRIGERYV